MYTIKQIIENQKINRKLILNWFTQDLRESKKILIDIKSKDKYIQEQVEKLKNRFKKTLYKNEIDKLFFMHPKRNTKIYAWWNKEEQVVIILNYGKK